MFKFMVCLRTVPKMLKCCNGTLYLNIYICLSLTLKTQSCLFRQCAASISSNICPSVCLCADYTIFKNWHYPWIVFAPQKIKLDFLQKIIHTYYLLAIYFLNFPISPWTLNICLNSVEWISIFKKINSMNFILT